MNRKLMAWFTLLYSCNHSRTILTNLQRIHLKLQRMVRRERIFNVYHIIYDYIYDWSLRPSSQSRFWQRVVASFGWEGEPQVRPFVRREATTGKPQMSQSTEKGWKLLTVNVTNFAPTAAFFFANLKILYDYCEQVNRCYDTKVGVCGSV